MTTAMQIGETARDRADFCRCFKTGAAVFLHDDGVVAHSTYRNTSRAAYLLARTNCDTRGCKPFGIRMRWLCTPDWKLNPASKRSRIGRCSWLMRDVCSLIDGEGRWALRSARCQI